MSLQIRDDYEQILRTGITLLDVRAPVEFQDGAFATSVNAPLLDDVQRAEVGKRYKESGQDAAIELGHQLVDDAERESRVRKWTAIAIDHPDLCLYCARGGLRSQISQRWLDEAGVAIPRVAGGYKALRGFGMSTLERAMKENEVVVVGGRTGAAKTRLIHARSDSVDLEGRANHRGSAFGRWPTPQPKQATFENQLACDVLRLRSSHVSQLVFEDEGKNVGHVSVPIPVVKKTSIAPLVVIEADIDARVDETINGYIVESLTSWVDIYGTDDGFERFSHALQESIDRIQKRLGGVRYQAIRAAMADALEFHRSTGDMSVHGQWIRSLLTDYYDHMYDYQLETKQDRIVFTGSLEAVNEWLDQNSARPST